MRWPVFVFIRIIKKKGKGSPIVKLIKKVSIKRDNRKGKVIFWVSYESKKKASKFLFIFIFIF